MSLLVYKFKYAPDPAGTSFTELANVQEITYEIGRQQQLDQYAASRALIVARYPSGYASPITSLVTGNAAQIVNSPGTGFTFTGTISNVTVKYGIPYASNVGPADYIFIQLEGNFARLGRAQGGSYAMAAADTWTQVSYCKTQSGVDTYWSNAGSGSTNPQLSATTVDGTWADWAGKMLQTNNGRMWDCSSPNLVDFISPFYLSALTPSTINFSDTTNNSTNQVYDQIEFRSLADNYYTRVTVTPEAVAAQTATLTGATTPYRVLNLNTLNSTTSQATDFANYYVGLYGQQSFGLASISCVAEAQNVFQLDAIGVNSAYGLATCPGLQINVTFRGTTITAIVEGVSVTATPGHARFTYYFSSAALNNILILNNTVFGKLNQNRLGY